MVAAAAAVQLLFSFVSLFKSSTENEKFKIHSKRLCFEMIVKRALSVMAFNFSVISHSFDSPETSIIFCLFSLSLAVFGSFCSLVHLIFLFRLMWLFIHSHATEHHKRHTNTKYAVLVAVAIVVVTAVAAFAVVACLLLCVIKPAQRNTKKKGEHVLDACM